MLQKIDRLEWDCPCESCRDKSPDSQHWSGEYDGQGINIVDADDSEAWYHIDLPPGVVLAQEVAQGDRTMDNTDDMTPQEQAAIRYEVAHMNCDDMPPINGVPARLLFDLVDVAGYAVTFAGEVDDPADPNAFAYLLDVAQATASSGREWLENYMAQSVESPASADPFAEFANAFDALAQSVNQDMRERGFWPEIPTDRNKAELVALMHSELSEALEAIRHGNPPDDHIPQYTGAEAELADVIIRIMDAAYVFGWDVPGALAAKVAYNRSRPYKHGKTC